MPAKLLRVRTRPSGEPEPSDLAGVADAVFPAVEPVGLAVEELGDAVGVDADRARDADDVDAFGESAGHAVAGAEAAGQHDRHLDLAAQGAGEVDEVGLALEGRAANAEFCVGSTEPVSSGPSIAGRLVGAAGDLEEIDAFALEGQRDLFALGDVKAATLEVGGVELYADREVAADFARERRARWRAAGGSGSRGSRPTRRRGHWTAG